MVTWGKRTRPLTRGVHFLECPLLTDFTTFVSFPYPRAGPAISAVFLEWLYLSLSFPKQFFVFLIWRIVREMELEKSRTILHIRGQNCSLATRSHTQFNYIYKLPNTFLLLPNHSEMRPQKSWDLSPPVPNNPPTLSQLFSRTSRGIRKNWYLYPLINSCFLIFFWN